MKIKIRQVQCNPKLGLWKDNLAMHLEAIDQAIDDEQDLIMFPELSLTGYFLKDQTHEEALALDDPAWSPLLERSHSISIVLGFIERARDGRLYNATGFMEDGRWLRVHHKVHLVTYGMFQDGRDWAAGERFEAACSKHGKFGLLACEDMWHIDGAYLYFLDGVDALLIASASPARGVGQPDKDLENEMVEPAFASSRTWQMIQDHAAAMYQTPVIYTNRVGYEDGVLFSGGTRALDAHGSQLGVLEHFDEGTLDSELSTPSTLRARAITPLRRDERPRLFAAEMQRRLDEQSSNHGESSSTGQKESK